MIEHERPFPEGRETLSDSFGERPIYDVVSQCSRCGYCEQSCPSYVVTGEEKHSPRGRNQLVRMLLENKLDDPNSASAALEGCLLCGSCSTACYASVPTAELVLEGKRHLKRLKGGGGLKDGLMRFFFDHPKISAALIRLAHAFRKTRLDRLAARLGLFRLFGLRALGEAALHVEKSPLRFLTDSVSRREQGENPDWIFFPACGTQFLFPEAGRDSIAVLESTSGSGRCGSFLCCGLLANNYGDLEAAREQARRVIARYEGDERAAVVGDCSSCVAHLKSYPQLFPEGDAWKTRAESFSSRVRDLSEKIDPETLPGREENSETETTTLHHACRSIHGQGLSEKTQRLVEAAGGRFRPIPDPSWCCGGAGAYGFSQPELSEEILRRKMESVAEVQADAVVTTSTSCLIQLAAGAKKYYPDARVVPLGTFIRERLD